jgi:hypothetical protein
MGQLLESAGGDLSAARSSAQPLDVPAWDRGRGRKQRRFV